MFASSPNIGNCMFLKKETKYVSVFTKYLRAHDTNIRGWSSASVMVAEWSPETEKGREVMQSCVEGYGSAILWHREDVFDMAVPYHGTKRMFLRDSMGGFFCGWDDTGWCRGATSQMIPLLTDIMREKRTFTLWRSKPYINSCSLLVVDDSWLPPPLPHQHIEFTHNGTAHHTELPHRSRVAQSHHRARPQNPSGTHKTFFTQPQNMFANSKWLRDIFGNKARQRSHHMKFNIPCCDRYEDSLPWWWRCCQRQWGLYWIISDQP